MDVVRRVSSLLKPSIIVWIAILGTVIVVYRWDDDSFSSNPSTDESSIPVQIVRDDVEHFTMEAELESVTKTATTTTTTEKPTSKKINIDQWLKKVTKKKPNVLFLIADDMRPDIKAQAHSQSPWIFPGMHTPNLDGLAENAMLFRRAYCQQSWCNPSRSSFLTSRRPETTMVHNNSVYFRQVNPNLVTIPQYFRDNGYMTLGMGKIFHLMGLPGDHDDEFSWSVPVYRNGECIKDSKKPWEAVKDEDRNGLRLLDELVAQFAVETLDKIGPLSKKNDQPFFMAVGMKKPHLPFVFPEEYLDLYPEENLTEPINPKAPEDMPGIAWFHSFEIRGRKEYKKAGENWDENNPIEKWVTQELRRAYWATISFIDDLLGKVLRKLESSGLADNTIIAFIGDHGFHLGEHSIIGKNTNFEIANNSPMMLKIPGVTDGGAVTDKLVEFVDLFPTLADLAGLPSVPFCPPGNRESQKTDLCTEGSSLVKLFQEKKEWKDRIFYQYPHYVNPNWCMGYSMRTTKYRYTEWVDYDYKTSSANWTDSCGVELYDHESDPNETKNIALKSELQTTVSELSALLRSGWRQAQVS